MNHPMTRCLSLAWLAACGAPADGELLSSKAVEVDDGIAHHRVVYGSDGLRVEGHVALPEGEGPFPVVLFNHGGFNGMGGNDFGRMTSLASRGVAVFASSYRGEDSSRGEVEYCYGERRDVTNLLTVALDWGTSVDASTVSAVGFSHGACISLFLPEEVPGIRGVVGIGSPVEIDDHIAWHEGEGNQDFADEWKVYVGDQGREMSPLYADFTPPVVLMSGAEDERVPTRQSCLLLDRFAQEGWPVGSYRVQSDGSPGEVEPDSCQPATTGTDPADDPAMDTGVILVSYAGVPHTPSDRVWQDAFDVAAAWVLK